MLWPCQWDAIFSTLLLFWCQLSVFLNCQKVKLWMLWESICFSVIRIGCKHFWEVWLKFEHIFQIRLSKIQCCCWIAQILIGCYNFSFYFVWIHWKSKGKNLAKFRRIVSLQFWRNPRGEECSISPARQAAASEAFEKIENRHCLFWFQSSMWELVLVIFLWFPSSFGVMLLMFHFLSSMWALIFALRELHCYTNKRRGAVSRAIKVFWEKKCLKTI